jgi:type IV secretory pathway TrbF-like protein
METGSRYLSDKSKIPPEVPYINPSEKLFFRYNKIVKAIPSWRLWLAVALLVVSLVLLVAVFWPSGHVHQVVPFPTIQVTPGL